MYKLSPLIYDTTRVDRVKLYLGYDCRHLEMFFTTASITFLSIWPKYKTRKQLRIRNTRKNPQGVFT